MIHDLKCWPEYFQAVKSGVKPFEYRKDDRGYEVGDVLHLREYDPKTDTYTGDEVDKTVTYILPLNIYGTANERYVIMGITPRPDWTPCAEGLPKNQGQYQCTIKDSRLATWLKVEPINMLGVRYFYDGRWYNRDDVDPDVIAWQPLPDPYNTDHMRDTTKKVDQFREPTKMMED